MPGGLTLLAATPASIPNPPAGKITIFFNTTANAPFYKDSSGNLFPLVGAQGLAGSFIVGSDGVDGEDGISNIPGIQGPPGNTGATGPAGPAIVLTEDIIYPDDLFVPSQPGASSGGGGAWQLVSSNSPVGVSNVDFINLGGFTDLRVIVRGMTFGSNSKTQLRVSTDNGATFKSASGDYLAVTGAGQESAATESDFYDAVHTTAKSGEMVLLGINMTTAPKSTRITFFNTDGEGLRLIPTTSAVNAIRVFAGVNFTGGTIFVMGR